MFIRQYDIHSEEMWQREMPNDRYNQLIQQGTDFGDNASETPFEHAKMFNHEEWRARCISINRVPLV